MREAKYPARSERLRIFFNQFKIKNVDAAKKIGLNRAAFISQLLNKNATLTADMANKISNAYPKLNVRWLLFGEGEMLVVENPSVVNEPRAPYYKESPGEQLQNLLDGHEKRIADLETEVRLLKDMEAEVHRLRGLVDGLVKSGVVKE